VQLGAGFINRTVFCVLSFFRGWEVSNSRLCVKERDKLIDTSGCRMALFLSVCCSSANDESTAID
jgi:hypothetical protein